MNLAHVILIISPLWSIAITLNSILRELKKK
jgi:hypothetical protein